MKILIKKEEFEVHHTVKSNKNKVTLHILVREGRYYSLAIYPDHYRLYRPLGQSLPVKRENLSDIFFCITDKREKKCLKKKK